MSPLRLAALLLLPTAAAAQSGALADAPPCRRALAAYEAAASADANDRAAALARRETARREAAVACLGGPDSAASALRAAQPAARVDAIKPAPLLPRSMAPGTTLPPSPRSTAPTTLTACDASGCWTSDGTRLQRSGPLLLGPRGVCSGSGPFVQCP